MRERGKDEIQDMIDSKYGIITFGEGDDYNLCVNKEGGGFNTYDACLNKLWEVSNATWMHGVRVIMHMEEAVGEETRKIKDIHAFDDLAEMWHWVGENLVPPLD